MLRLHWFTQHISQFRQLHFLTFSLSPLFPFCKILFTCQTRTTTSDLPFCNILVLQKVPFSQISDDVIVYDLWFAPPPSNQKSWLRLWLKFFAKDKRVNSGVARGVGRPASGVTILFFFLLRPKTH